MVPYCAEPLSLAAIREQQEKQHHIKGTVMVELADIVASDLEQFFDMLSEKLTGSDGLMGIDYTIVGHDATALFLTITGDASLILETEGDSTGEITP